MERVVVSDTNIFIDLIKLGALGDMFLLPWEIYTTDFVISELEDPKQRDIVLGFQQRNKLIIKTFSSSQLIELYEFMSSHSRKLSLTDSSVWLYAKKEGYTILSGDRKLLSKASTDNVEAHGLLFIFDNLVEYNILPEQYAAALLEELKAINKWLPISEIDKRIERYSVE